MPKRRAKLPPREDSPPKESSPDRSPRRPWRPDRSKSATKRRQGTSSPARRHSASPARHEGPFRARSSSPPRELSPAERPRRATSSPPGSPRQVISPPPVSPGTPPSARRASKSSTKRRRAASSPPGSPPRGISPGDRRSPLPPIQRGSRLVTDPAPSPGVLPFPGTVSAPKPGGSRVRPSPLPSILHGQGGRLELTQSTLTATSPDCHRPAIPRLGLPFAMPGQDSAVPPRTPPRLASPGIPRTPGYSSDERPPRARLDCTSQPPVDIDLSVPSEAPWDRMSPVSSTRSPTGRGPEDPSQEPPLTWYTIVDTVYASGMVSQQALPASPPPVQSVLGGPPPAKRRRTALPPSPLAAAALDSAMRSCWGGSWPSHLQHQPPPPNAALHPTPSGWVPDFKVRYHAGPGFDLKPARLSAREKEWAGSHQPSVEYSWLNEIDMMARAQLSSVSALEWLLGVLFDSHSRASPAQLQSLREFVSRELTHTANFSGAVIAASTLARRRAILDRLTALPRTTRNWLQLQPVALDTSQGLFGPASAAVPEILRQQPHPARAAHSQRSAPRASTSYRRPVEQRAPPSRPGPSATYTPSAAREQSAPEPRPRQSRGPSSKGPKRRS